MAAPRDAIMIDCGEDPLLSALPVDGSLDTDLSTLSATLRAAQIAADDAHASATTNARAPAQAADAADDEPDLSVSALLRHISAAGAEVGEFAPVNVALALHYLLGTDAHAAFRGEDAGWRPKKAREPVRLPPRLGWHGLLACAAYAKDMKELTAALDASHTHTHTHTHTDVIMAQFQPTGVLPAHLLLCDRSAREFLLVIRGTRTWSELLIDVAGARIAFCGADAHAGMAALADGMLCRHWGSVNRARVSAAWVRRDVSAASASSMSRFLFSRAHTHRHTHAASGSTNGGGPDAEDDTTPPRRVLSVDALSDSTGLLRVLDELLEAHPGWTVRTIGHSLGAGVAALLAVKLRVLLDPARRAARAAARSKVGADEGAAGHDLASPLPPKRSASLPGSPATLSAAVASEATADGSGMTGSVVFGSAAAAEQDLAAVTAAAESSKTVQQVESRWNISLRDVLQSEGPVASSCFATPACMSPDLACLAAASPAQLRALRGECASATESAEPLVVSLIVQDDFVPRLTPIAVKRLQARLQHPELLEKATQYSAQVAREFGSAVRDRILGVFTRSQSVSVAEAGDGTVIASGAATTVVQPIDAAKGAALFNKSASGSLLSGLASTLGEAYKSFRGHHVAASDMAEVYNTVAPPAPTVPEWTIARRALLDRVTELPAPACNVVREFVATAVQEFQVQVVPGCILHVERASAAGRTGSPEQLNGIADSVHHAVAAADAAHVDADVSSEWVEGTVTDDAFKGVYRVYRKGPGELADIVVSRTMWSDHRRKLYAAVAAAVTRVDAA